MPQARMGGIRIPNYDEQPAAAPQMPPLMQMPPQMPPPAPVPPAPVLAPMQPSAPAPPSPAMDSLSALAEGEGFREGFEKEGWASQGVPDLSYPQGRQLPASSRALAQLVNQRGTAY